MKKFFILILMFLYSLISQCQDSTNKAMERNVDILAIERYIEEIHSINDSKNIVFLLELHVLEKDKACFDLSYVLNWFEFESILPTHYMEVNDDIVVICMQEEIDKELIKDYSFKKMTERILFNIKNKIIDEQQITYTYAPQVLVYHRNGEEVFSEFYEDSQSIPFEITRDCDLRIKKSLPKRN